MKLGMHFSIAGSIDSAVDRANELGCDTFQIFTRSPRRWMFKLLDEAEVEDFRAKAEEFDMAPLVVHMPYLPNLASHDDVVYGRSVTSLKSELERTAQLGIPYLVTHLGSHLGRGREAGLKRLVAGIDECLGEVENDVQLLLENTAGQKNSMGTSVEELREIMDRVRYTERVGVCFDTCHAFAAGYDLRTEDAVDETLELWGRTAGFQTLKVVHLNDSKGELGSRRDRHDHIGLGNIGEEGFRAVIHDRTLRSLPMIMETPIDERRDDISNMRRLRELAGMI
ncbi:MAG: deoxyribonuclease IV [Candidatus Geothermarchaeales archaeon]